MSQQYMETFQPVLASQKASGAGSDARLVSWKNSDYLTYILKNNPSYKKEKWSKWNESWNRYNALVMMANRGEISGSLASVVNSEIFKAIVLADDNTLSTAAAKYGFPSSGGSRLALEVAITVYQYNNITGADIQMVGRLNVEFANVLREVQQ